MICALLDFEVVNEQVNGVALSSYPLNKETIFRCKMPTLPSDVPDMMGFEVLSSHIRVDNCNVIVYYNAFLYLLDNAENCHNNTLTNEIPLLTMTRIAMSDVIGGGRRMSLNSNVEIKAHKIYISTHQNYLYFKIKDTTDSLSNGYYRIVKYAKIIIRLTFDKTQNDYQPKRIML